MRAEMELAVLAQLGALDLPSGVAHRRIQVLCSEGEISDPVDVRLAPLFSEQAFARISDRHRPMLAPTARHDVLDLERVVVNGRGLTLWGIGLQALVDRAQ